METVSATSAEFLRAIAATKDAYAGFKNLLVDASNEDWRGISLFLQDIFKEYETWRDDKAFAEKYGFGFQQIQLGGSKKPLLLLQLPSIFAPENWSYTFYEGLCRIPKSDFAERSLAELGCGNGWISIAMAIGTSLSSITGLDINPQAITCARLNLILNGFDQNGDKLTDDEGIPIITKVEFHQSDLLQYAEENRLVFHKIIGCIPQVLSPDTQETTIAEDSCSSKLYDLSNYYQPQGYTEDQFGLGLIAKAVEQSLSCLKPWGELVFNFGGRPGIGVIEHLFRRRGMKVARVWSTQAEQAGDTEIAQLVEIEKNSPHRFEFFMDINSQTPISATTAARYAQAGGKIYHSLMVYRAWCPAQRSTRQILQYTGREENRHLLDEMDLGAEAPDEVFHERVGFLASLAEQFNRETHIPYEDTAGLSDFRRRLATFFRVYHQIPLSEESFLCAPSRSDLVSLKLLVYRPKLVFLDAQLAAEMPVLAEHAEALGCTLLEVPRSGELMVELMERLRPDLVITAFSYHQNLTGEHCQRLLQLAQKINCLMVLDITEHFDFSSNPNPMGALSPLRSTPLGEGVCYMAGLEKNQVYRDLSLCVVFSEDGMLLEHLIHASEFTYSRTPYLTQKYYDLITSDLLSFQLISARGMDSRVRIPTLNRHGLCAAKIYPGAELALSKESIGQIPSSAGLNRLDYGENSLESPLSLQQGIYESFLGSQQTKSASTRGTVADFLRVRFGIDGLRAHAIATGLGVAPMYSALMMFLLNRHSVKQVFFPSGCYGEFITATQLVGLNHHSVKTTAESAFKWTEETLEKTLQQQGPGWIFLNGPVVNPTAQIYSRQEIQQLWQVAAKYQGHFILDTTFDGLDFQDSPQDVESSLQLHSLQGCSWVLLGTLSKTCASGGLRFGYGTASSPAIIQHLQQHCTRPHHTVGHACSMVLTGMSQQQSPTCQHLQQQRLVLKSRAEALSQQLKSFGWEVLTPEGGLFLLAKPTAYLGKSFSLGEQENSVNLTGPRIAEAMRKTVGLSINSDRWTGIEGYMRFVLSVSEPDFNTALRQLERFHELVTN